MHGTLTETPTTTRTTESTSGTTQSGGGGNPVKSSLREMSYADGEKALSPVVDTPVQVAPTTEVTGEGEGEVTMSGAGTATTEAATDDPSKAQSGANPPPGNNDKKTEVEQVAELHEQTVEALVTRLKDLQAKKQRVFVWRKEKQIAEDAKGIFGLLATYDSQTITTRSGRAMRRVRIRVRRARH